MLARCCTVGVRNDSQTSCSSATFLVAVLVMRIGRRAAGLAPGCKSDTSAKRQPPPRFESAAAPRCLGKPYASKLILSQTNPRIDAAPVCLAFVLAVSMCQPGLGRSGTGCAAAARLGSATDAFSPDPSKCEALRLAACDPSGACVGWALTVLRGFREYGRAKPSA